MQHGARQDLEMLVLRLKRAIVTGFTVNEINTYTENALREMKFCSERIASMKTTDLNRSESSGTR